MEEKKSREKILKQLEDIYKDRKEEYGRWEKELEERRVHVEKLLGEFSQKQKEIDAREKHLREKERHLNEQAKQLDEQKESFSRMYPEFEKMKSEVMRLKREKDTYDFDKALQSSKSDLLAEYIPKKEHDAIVGGLEKQIRDLQKERLGLLKDSLGLDKGSETVPDHYADADEERELTADVLADYIRNLNDKESALSLDSVKDQLEIKRNDIIYRFLFTMPGEFFVIADRRDQDVVDLEKKYPELQIARKDDQIIVTGYFTGEISPSELVRRVYEIGGYLQ